MKIPAEQGAAPAVVVRRAGRGDAATVAGIMTRAASWLNDNEKWNDWPVPCPVALVEERMAASEVYVARESGVAVGTFALRWEDERYWGDRPPDAGYVHQLAILPSRSGAGLGRALLEWAGSEIRRRGRGSLRLDCPATNAGLCAYYERNAFRRVGERVMPTGYHAVLYERPVA
jgi:protein-tyrosine phosphatase